MKMTGATIVVKDGGQMIWAKVRHDGCDIVDYLKGLNLEHLSGCGQKIVDGYFKYRVDNGTYDPEYAIETRYPNGYVMNSAEFAKYPFVADSWDKINERFYDAINAEDEDGYMCGYEDYCIMLDCDVDLVAVRIGE